MQDWFNSHCKKDQIMMHYVSISLETIFPVGAFSCCSGNCYYDSKVYVFEWIVEECTFKLHGVHATH